MVREMLALCLPGAGLVARPCYLDPEGDVVINRVILGGHVSQYGPKIEWTSAGKAQTTFHLVVAKGGFKTFVPCVCVGGKAEEVAERLEPGELVMLEGSLEWRGGKTKDSGKLVVVCFDVECLLGATVERAN